MRSRQTPCDLFIIGAISALFVHPILAQQQTQSTGERPQSPMVPEASGAKVAQHPHPASDGSDWQSAGSQAAALQEIVAVAADICQTVPIEQASGQVALTANASAKLDGLIGKLVSVGAGVGASTVSNSSRGVLQADLAKTIEKGNDCKVSVLKTLVPRMLPDFTQASSGSPPAGGFASVDEVVTANGSFKKQGEKWIEYPPYAPGSYFTFTEVSRDPNAIILSDPSRQKPGETNNPMLVRLPTHGGAVQWSYTNPVVWMDFTIAQPALK